MTSPITETLQLQIVQADSIRLQMIKHCEDFAYISSAEAKTAAKNILQHSSIDISDKDKK